MTTRSAAVAARRLAREKARLKADQVHEKYVIRMYKLLPGQYAEMLAAQDGRCAICMRLVKTRRLAVDHDHATGLIRGALLCSICNHYLGRFEFDPIVAYNAAQYLLAIEALFPPLTETP